VGSGSAARDDHRSRGITRLLFIVAGALFLLCAAAYNTWTVEIAARAARAIFHRPVLTPDAGPIHGAQLGRHQPAGGLGQAPAAFRILVVHLAEARDRRQAGEAFAEALYPSALMVHGHEQRRLAQLVDFAHQCLDLCGGLVVAREQNHPAGERMPETLTLLGGERESRHIQHHRAERHASSAMMCTRVPMGTRSNSSIRSRLRIFTQPCEPSMPILSSSGQPWI